MANPVGPGGTWTQVFEDTFDGPGLNTANWTAVQGVNNSNITTQASSVSVSGGFCNIILAGMINSRPSINGWPGPSNGPVLAVGDCCEASINWPGFAGNSPYNWPAWWVSGQSWPANGEEDIFESYNGTPSALNYHNASGANNGPFPSGNWCNSFHTYTLVRGQTTLQCWWDGVLVRSIARNDNGGPQSLIVFMANANTSSATAVAKVDYVRMWTPGGTGGSSPTVVTSAATGITDTAVTLNGTVNPNSLAATYQFEYGTTTGYGTATPGSPGSVGAGTAAISESANVTGLTASSLYHYRLNGTNSGGVSHGNDQSFTTQAPAGGGGGGGGGGSLPTLAYSNTQTATSALSYRATPAVTTSGATTETTWSVNKQTGTVSGDWIFIYVFGGTASMACTGFTAKPDANGFGGLLYRLADGTEGSSFSITGLAGHVVSTLIATVAGAASTLDPATVGTPVSGGASTSIPVASITLANANDWCLWFASNENGFGGPGLAITPPAGFTSQATNGGATGNATIMLADNETIGTGATGTKTGTFASSFYSGVMVAVTPAAGAGTLTSTSFTPQTGDIIVTKLVGEDAGITFNTPTGGGWTYTSQLSDTTASHVSARIYTAPVTSGGTPQTVAETPTWGAFANALMTVELWRGAALAATPATCDSRGTGAPSTTLTTTAANSVVSWASGDFADVNGVSRTYNTTSATPTEDGYVFSTARMTAYAAYQSAVTAGSQTLGLTAPTGQTWTLTGIEIQSSGSGGGAGGGVLSYRATPAVTASSGNVSSWTVTKQAGTVAGDWIFIYLFGCDYSTTVACSGFTVTEDSLGFGALFYRLADGTEASTFTITGLGGAGPATTVIATVAGATSALDPNVVPTVSSGGPATTIPVGGITLSQAGDWLLWFAGNQNSFTGPGYAISAPSGFTSQATNGAAAANATVMLADNESPGTGATGTKTGTATSSTYYSGVMVGVTAGAATGGGPSSSPGAQPAGATGAAKNATITTSGSVTAHPVVATGVAMAIQPATVTSGSASPNGVAAPAVAAALNATVLSSPGVVWFPGIPLGCKVELLLNNIWTDITAYTFTRDPVQITGFGRSDWTSTIQAAQMTLTLDNRDGRFSPKNSAGAYFPFVARNTQIRVSVSAQSITHKAYSGYRFWGEVSEWPVRWDPSASDITAVIVASGIWRRISQLQTTLGSAFTRYNSITLVGANQPYCYWPCEDGTGATQLVPFDSVAGTPNATFTVTGTNAPSLASSTDFKGSDALVLFNGAQVNFTVPAGGSATSICVRMAVSVPPNGDSAGGTGNWNLAEIDTAGTVAKLEVYILSSGKLEMHGVSSANTVLFIGTTTTDVRGKPVLVSAELTPSGGNVAFALRIITQGASGITESVTGVLNSASIGSVTKVILNRSLTLMDTGVGHLSVTYGAVPTMVGAAAALGGYVGEKGMDRFTRICGEMGIPAQTIGVASTTAAMGPQVDDHLADVLQIIEDTDCGLLYETRDQFGLGYRSNASMANQVIATSFDYNTAVLDQSLAPTYDDSLIRNNVVITNWTGFAQQAILTAGPMSIFNPPNGVGNGYSFTRTVSAASDSQTTGIANFILNLGTVDEVRFPVVSLKMARTQNAALFSAVPGLRIGDYFQITNPPSFLTSNPNFRLLVWGCTETLGPKQWDFDFNAVSEVPWETGFSPGTIQLAQIPGGSAVTSAAPGAGGLGGIIANGSITPSMLSGGITVHTLGGNAITLSSGPPPNPNVNDLWINSSTGLISQWNGTAWIPYKIDASQTVQAGTIIGSNIAASTISSALLAAGIVVAGIVDATTIQANQYLAYSGQGELLAYSSTAGWSFAVSGVPSAKNYFIVGAGQGSLIQVGNSFTWTGGGGPYTVASISAPAFGFVNVFFTPNSPAVMSSGTVASGSGAAGTGSLINSIAGASGTDQYANTYPAGLYSQQITLPSQGSAPPTFAGSSVLYTSSAGRLRYISQGGADLVLDRSALNLSNFTMSTQTTPTVMSGALSYLANEAIVGSEYEVEIDGTVTSPNITAVQFTFDYFLDGVAFNAGSAIDVGAVVMQTGLTYAYTLRARATVQTAGAGGTVNCALDGGMTRKVSGVGNTSQFTTLNNVVVNCAFDTTANHSLAIYCHWAGSPASGSAITYRTKITRRY